MLEAPPEAQPKNQLGSARGGGAHMALHNYLQNKYGTAAMLQWAVQPDGKVWLAIAIGKL
jgi:hypothetical protein